VSAPTRPWGADANPHIPREVEREAGMVDQGRLDGRAGWAECLSTTTRTSRWVGHARVDHGSRAVDPVAPVAGSQIPDDVARGNVEGRPAPDAPASRLHPATTAGAGAPRRTAGCGDESLGTTGPVAGRWRGRRFVNLQS
jgi:hypothetical protein